jgi:hypothetical protein
MLKEVTLESTGRHTYKEPEGEFLEVIEKTQNSITVLTRVNTDKADRLPFDPSALTVTELRARVAGAELSSEERLALIEEEHDGKDRTTAIDVLRES